jgi:uncharacterized protein YdcH (DUF465 family)
MSVHYFRSLLMKSAVIEQEIEKEQSNKRPNWMRLLHMKKIRLSIKDRLHALAKRGVKPSSAKAARQVFQHA